MVLVVLPEPTPTEAATIVVSPTTPNGWASAPIVKAGIPTRRKLLPGKLPAKSNAVPGRASGKAPVR